MSTDSVRIWPVERVDALFAMREDWNSLLARSTADTVFLTWEWATAWWRAYGAGKRLWVLRAERNGQLLGLVPLYRRRCRRFGWIGCDGLFLIGDGSGDSDYLDAIVKSGEEEAVADATADFLAQHCKQWDLLCLSEIPATSVSLRAFRTALQARGCLWEEVGVPCAYVRLPDTWDEYMTSLRPRMRTKIRSLTRRLGEQRIVTFDRCADPRDLVLRLDSLFRLHGRRWARKGQVGVFADPAKRRFYWDIGEQFLARDWLRFYSLSINGEYVAHQFCFEYNRRMFLLQEGFEPAWEEPGVGNVLRVYVFRDCVERGLGAYDFLGGMTPHKLSWGADVKMSVRASAGLPSAKNRLLFSLPRGVEAGKRTLKAVLPATALTWARALTDRKSPWRQPNRGAEPEGDD